MTHILHRKKIIDVSAENLSKITANVQKSWIRSQWGLIFCRMKILTMPRKKAQNSDAERSRIFATNVCFTKKFYFYERIKLRLVLSVTNNPFTFFAFFYCPWHVNFLTIFSSPHSWGVKKPSCKNWYIFGENWQRNQFPKLDTFFYWFFTNVTTLP